MSAIFDIVQMACETNDLSQLSTLDIDKRTVLAANEHGNIPIMLAAAAGNIEVIKFFDDMAEKALGYNAYKIFSARNKQGYNALSYAAKNGHIPAVITLYELGAYDIFTANEVDWQTYAAMQINHQEDVQGVAQRLKLDALSRLKEIYNKALFNEVTFTHSSPENIRKAIQKVTDINAPIYDEHSALYHAIRYRNATPVKVLLEEGAKVEPEMVPLALDSKNDEIISLIGQNIPLTAAAIDWGNLFDVLLDHAVRKNDAKVAVKLLPHMTMEKLQEALLYCAEIDSPDVLRALINHHVDINCRENHVRARTALMLAAKNGHADIVKLLLDSNADTTLRSERGFIKGLTALDYAKIYRRKVCVQLLRAAIVLRKYGDTALNRIVISGDIDVLSRQLFAYEDDIIPPVNVLMNAIKVAKESKQPRMIVKKLQQFMHDHYSKLRLVGNKIFGKKSIPMQ